MNFGNIPQMEPVYGSEEVDALLAYFQSGGWGTEFRMTEKFENQVARYTGSKYAIATNNGTISLTMALMALGLKPGDEILVPNLTMIATYTSAVMIGVVPKLVEIDPVNLCMDIQKAKSKISSKTKALVYVSLNGRSHDMNEIVDFCEENNLLLIEDAAQSLGSFNKDKKHLGTFGSIGSFSFSTPKIITTGQGGMLITDDKELREKLIKLKNFGRSEGGMDFHDTVGFNFKFTDFQAVIGIEQMKKLKDRVSRKKEMFDLYKELLEDSSIEFIETDLNLTAPWFIDIYTDKKKEIMEKLRKKNIGTRAIYPPVSSQKIVLTNQRFPVSDEYSRKGLWLPSSVNLTNEHIQYICDIILTSS